MTGTLGIVSSTYCAGWTASEGNFTFVERREFDPVVHAEAEAIGPPGQRRFRLVFASNDEAAFLWLEKQQLQALGVAFEQILTHLQQVQVSIPLSGEVQEESSGADPVGLREMQVGRLQVGYDDDRELVTVFVHGIETPDEEPPDFVGRLTVDQSGDLAMQIRRVVNLGARNRSNGHMSRP